MRKFNFWVIQVLVLFFDATFIEMMIAQFVILLIIFNLILVQFEALVNVYCPQS